MNNRNVRYTDLTDMIRRVCMFVVLLCVFLFSPNRVVAAPCTGMPAIRSNELSNCTLTISSVTGVDEANNVEISSTNTASLTLNPGAVLTINSGGTLVVGSIVLNGGTIALSSTNSQIRPNTPLYVFDDDDDGWAATALTEATLYTSTASGRRRLSLMRGTAADCSDTDDYRENNICCSDYTYYTDADADGYGSTTANVVCQETPSVPNGYANNNTDCNDGSSLVFTSHAQCYSDADGDTYTNGAASNTTCLNAASCSTATRASASTTGAAVTAYTAGRLRDAASATSDCNDTGTNAANVYLTAACYVDADNDDYGSTTARTCTNHATCSLATWASTGHGSAATSGNFASNNTDCYDSNANAKPGSTTCSGTNRGDGSFDYNCSSTSTRCNGTLSATATWSQFTQMTNCTCRYWGSTVTYYQFSGSAACGATGYTQTNPVSTLTNCDSDAYVCTYNNLYQSYTTSTQACQ